MMYSRNTYACVLLAAEKSGYDRFSGRAAAPRGKNKRRANLAGFQDIADAVLKPWRYQCS